MFNCNLLCRITVGSSACDIGRFGPYIEGAAVNKQGALSVNRSIPAMLYHMHLEAVKLMPKGKLLSKMSIASYSTLPAADYLALLAV